jgi:hypothetical protein
MSFEFRIPNSESVTNRATAGGHFIRHSKFVVRNLLLSALLFASPALHACSVCFGNSDSKLTQGMLAGVLVLLLVVISVLGGFVVLFVHLARRAAAVAALENQSTESKVNS